MKPNIFEVQPHKALGPILLDMRRSDVHLVLGAPESTRDEYTTDWGITFPPTDYYFDNSLQISYDSHGCVEFIEAVLYPKFQVVYRGIDLLRTPAEDVALHLSRISAVSTEEDDYPASHVYRSLDLSLWRSFLPNENERRDSLFETVGVGRQGYFA